MSHRDRISVSHVAAFVAAAVAHAALLALLLTARKQLVDFDQIETAPITFFPAESEREPLVESPKLADRTTAKPRPVQAREPPRSSAPVAIDWSKAATLSAERQVAAADEAERQASAFDRRSRSGGIQLDTAPEPEPEFGWSHARTHRIERTKEGGVILWLNDRCFIVLSALMPICALGKRKANGALFEHMRDPPELGDWKD